MNDLIDKIEDILEEAKFHNEYGEDICLDNQEELAQKIYNLCHEQHRHQLRIRDNYIIKCGLWNDFILYTQQQDKING